MEGRIRQEHETAKQPLAAMDILQMNNQELDRFIRRKELENPLLELKGRKAEEPEDSRSRDIRRKLEWLDATDEQNRVFYREDLEDEEDRDEWNVPVEEEESLADFVYSQLSSSCVTPRDEQVLFAMADGLDARGYLTESLESLRRRFGLKEVEAYRYLYLLQSAEPAGVGARSLIECLLLQLDRMSEPNNMARRIIIECLPLLGENRLTEIAVKLGISMEETERSAALIRRLNPKPGSGFSSRENLRYVLPDVTVVKFRDYMQVLLNDTAYPQIRISRYYRQMMDQPEIGEEAREYIGQQIDNAEKLMEEIRRRSQILTEVTRALVEEQRDFFEKGPGNRRPLTMEETAEKIGRKVSVVKRAVQDKYLQCPWGIYPMNFFFMTPGAAEPGAGLSAAGRIREMIRGIIAEEDKHHPYSDQKVTEILQKRGVTISRRTVAKYRAEAQIPEAGKRRMPKD